MAVVKAISTQELTALANRLRLTLIRDRMEEMLTMAVDKKLSPRETLCIIHEKPHPKSDFFAHKSGTSRTILNGKSKLPALSSDFFAGSSVVSR